MIFFVLRGVGWPLLGPAFMYEIVINLIIGSAYEMDACLSIHFIGTSSTKLFLQQPQLDQVCQTYC
jgi:hypothetical protein